MKLKSYFSGTVEAAMALARKELGEEALLINARPATPETRYLGAYEVVFGLISRSEPTLLEQSPAAVPQKVMAAAAGISGAAFPPHKGTGSMDSMETDMQGASLRAEGADGERNALRLRDNLHHLRQEIEQLTAVARPAIPASRENHSPSPTGLAFERQTPRVPVNSVTPQIFNQFRQKQADKTPEPVSFEALLQADRVPAAEAIPAISLEQPRLRSSFAAALHRAEGITSSMVADTAPASSGKKPATGRMPTGYPEAPAARPDAGTVAIPIDAGLGRPGGPRTIVALIGPPGAGKTTTLVKLAMRYGLGCRRAVHILTADVHRIAAADQLRALAAILGVGFDVAETPRELARLLAQDRWQNNELVLIDTPGLAAQDFQQNSQEEIGDGDELAQVLAGNPCVDTHLLLPASMNREDMTRIVRQFAAFRPDKLLFTRLDETECYGSLAHAAANACLPVSFVTFGQRIPDDLEQATVERLLGRPIANRESYPDQDQAEGRLRPEGVAESLAEHYAGFPRSGGNPFKDAAGAGSGPRRSGQQHPDPAAATPKTRRNQETAQALSSAETRLRAAGTAA